MNFNDLQRFLNPIKRKLFLMIGKSLLTAINNEGKSGFYDSGTRSNPQRVSVDWFGQLTDIERSQEYGFETYPVKGTAKAIILSPDGSRANAFVVMVQDDTYRPTDLSEGDVCLYGKEDKTTQKHRLLLESAGNIKGLATKISFGNGTDELLSLLNDNLTEVIAGLKYIRDSSTYSNGGGPTGPPSNAALLNTPITNLEATQTALGNIKV